MIKPLIRWWRKRQRAIDIRILWPSICAQAQNERSARNAFLAHTLNDPAWRDVSLGEQIHTILNLEYRK